MAGRHSKRPGLYVRIPEQRVWLVLNGDADQCCLFSLDRAVPQPHGHPPVPGWPLVEPCPAPSGSWRPADPSIGEAGW
jgi:hypothetical protein